jgi:MFS family permease
LNDRSPSAATDPSAIPAGLGALYWFSAFNALSFQPILSSPMVLYAKSLGASATVLGILAGMMPLLVITQLPAAKFVDRVGYRRFVLGGWTTRVVVIFLLAAVPLTGGFLDHTTQLVLLLALLFAFNVFRGVASCAWLPWITELIPAASLPALKRIPDVPTHPEKDGTKGAVPWLELAAHPPFRKLLHVNCAWSLAYGGLTTFVVKYLKDGAGLRADLILCFMSVSFIGGMASPWLAGVRLDRLGSRPMLGFTMVLGFLIGVGWMLAAGGLIAPGWGFALPLMTLLGLVNALFSAANNRLAMQIVPKLGRNHFFALFMVVWQITLGLSPVLWGLLLDAIGPREATTIGFGWNRYSIYFGLVAAAFVWAFALCRRLEEPRAAEVQALVRELLVDEPRRWWTLVTGR